MVTEQDIIEYVMHTPGNSNPAVLKSLIESYGAEAGGGSGMVKEGTYDSEVGAYSFGTVQEVYEAMAEGQSVFFKADDRILQIVGVNQTENEYAVIATAGTFNLNVDQETGIIYGIGIEAPVDTTES